ncbi:SDR family NAD(P)-dependent oxidoreductase [Paludibacterium yongneupense]|uniref:SDR family NAD(P)-dependent oxidoreductase n=1 Tax=Paludibacterium yongneupense TaxID=400061 RepID=UPI0003F5DE29|nr:SDR family NAD(P)-dependent oxidoreductase [Paludibacterium yongneupense]
MNSVILITGTSSGFGALAARALARAGHTVYAGMRDSEGRNRPQADAVLAYAAAHDVALIPIELDVTVQDSVTAALATITAERRRLDVVVHNAGHMVFGPAEAFTPEQYAAVFDVNVLGTQRVNRAALPLLRAQGRGLLVWVSSSSARGGTPPYLAPYFAAKAAMDALAVSYAGELARWGIETSIIVPGAFGKGTHHFSSAGSPADTGCAADYAAGANAGLERAVMQGLSACEPQDADVTLVAQAIADVVATAHGQRPFRVHIDPADDGCEAVNTLADGKRAAFLRRIGLGDLLHPA